MHNVRLVDVSNELSKTEIESLKLCAHHLKRLGEVSLTGFDLWAFNFTLLWPLQYTYTTEVYKKMSDFSALATLFVEMQQWERVRVKCYDISSKQQSITVDIASR